jgi:Uma2 family endonuclease
MMYWFIEAAIPGWCVMVVPPVNLEDSEPEPDVALVRIDERTYDGRFPTAKDVGLFIEVADVSLALDQTEKGRIYARSGIPVYWVVNLVDRQVEVHTDPDPAATPPAYRTRTDYRPGDTVPLVLDGQPAGGIAVADLIP